MSTSLRLRCEALFAHSRKLQQIKPSSAQMENVIMRLRQIYADEELDQMHDKSLTRQIERVWPIAQYVDVIA